MAIFGAPVAHEDDAERAVRAGLGMQAAMVEINAELERDFDDVTSTLRVGVNTGEVLAGAVGESYTVIGDTVNVAARLQAAGAAGSVTVGERTLPRHRGGDRLRRARAARRSRARPSPCRPGRPPALSPSTPSRLRTRPRDAARRAAPTSSRCSSGLRARRARGPPAPGHARRRRPAWASRACCASSRARLRARDPAPDLRQGRCLPYGSSIVYWALGEVVRAECGIVDGDSAEVAWRKLTDRLEELLVETGERVTEETGRARPR